MRFLPEPGLLLDVISYTLMYFNHDSYQREKILYSDKTTDTFKYYDSFRQGKRRLDPPDLLYPFFSFNDAKSSYSSVSPLLSYFLNVFDFSTVDLKTLLDALSTEGFREYCLNYYFQSFSDRLSIGGLDAGNADDCMKALLVLQKQGERLELFYPFLRDFRSLIGPLRDYLEECYGRIASFHAQFGPELAAGVRGDYLANAESVDRSLDLKPGDGGEASDYTVHLINHMVLFHQTVRGTGKGVYFLGLSSVENVVGWTNYSSLDLLSFCNAFGNEIKRDIIMQLVQEEQTVSQLAAALYTSRSTVNRYVVSLYENLVIQISKKVGTETYYSLNPKYFLIAKEKVSSVIDYIIEKMI